MKISKQIYDRRKRERGLLGNTAIRLYLVLVNFIFLSWLAWWILK